MVVLMRDMLGITSTLKESRYILHNKTVEVNGIQRKDSRFCVGLFDIISFKEAKSQYQILLDKKGQLYAKEVKNSLRPRQIRNKTILKGKKIQLNFRDGTTMIVDKNGYKVGDSVVVKDKKIVQHIPFEKGSTIFLIGGKHIGSVGVLEDIMDNKIIYKSKDNEKIETLKKYGVVIGKEKPLIEV